MRGKIDKHGVLYKELPGEGMVPCLCVNEGKDVPELAEICLSGSLCYHHCAPFEGPLPERRCTTNGPCGTETICDLCHAYTPTGRTLIKICQGRELVFDEFVDERVK